MARIFNAANTTRPPGYAVTRSGAGATRVNSSKVRVTVPANTERVDYDQNTGNVRGVYFEIAATNFLPQSNDFLYSTWYKAPNASITQIAGAGLNGATTVYRFYSTQDGAALARGPDSSIPSAPQKTISARVKSRTGVAQTAGFWDGGQSIQVDIPATGYAVVQYTCAANKSPEFNFYSFFGNGTLDIEIEGSQEEIANASGLATSYIDTGAGASSGPVTRGVEKATFTLGSGVTQLTFTYDDASTQVFSGLTPGSTYTIDPANLNRPLVMYIDDNSSAGGSTYPMSATGRAENVGTTKLTERYALRTQARAENIGTVSVKKQVLIRTAAASEDVGTVKLTQRWAIRTVAQSEMFSAISLVKMTRANGIYGNGVYGYPAQYGNYNPVLIASIGASENTGTARLVDQKAIRLATAASEYRGTARLNVEKAIRPAAADEFVGTTVMVVQEKVTGFLGRTGFVGVVALRAQVPIRPVAASEYRGTVTGIRPSSVTAGAASFVGQVRMTRWAGFRLMPASGQFLGSVRITYAWSNLGVRPNPDLWYDPTATVDPWQTARPNPEL